MVIINISHQDFSVFSSIHQTEYVGRLFQQKEAALNLTEFELLFNREMLWVMTEVVCERNVYRRAKLVKKFIKIARHCRELHNLVIIVGISAVNEYNN
jgi:hypothetical protein